MNKLMVFILALITLGLIASPAFAGDRLAASNFFYGETIANPLANGNSTAVIQMKDTQNQAISLSAVNFFYGDQIPNYLRATNIVSHYDNVNAAALPGQLEPGTFYGYTDNTIVKSCNCPCSNC